MGHPSRISFFDILRRRAYLFLIAMENRWMYNKEKTQEVMLWKDPLPEPFPWMAAAIPGLW
jgi:hypothetical protein